jgi:hypothetical protein
MTGPGLPAWSDQAASILAPRLDAAAEALVRLEGKVELARTLLSTVAMRSPFTRFAVEQAWVRLEKAQISAGLARVILRREAEWTGLAARAAMSRREVAELRPLLYQVHEALSGLARRTNAIRPTPGEIGDIDRAAQTAREALSVLQAVAEVLLDLSSHPGGGLTPGDLRALGLAFVGSGIAPQIRWNEESVAELSRRRGEPRRARPVAPASADGSSVHAVDVLRALKASALELAQVDPGQLRPAALFVAEAKAHARVERLAHVVDAFHVLARSPRPAWSRSKMASHLAGMARVPTSALQRLSDHEVQDRYQEVTRALNTGPGPFHTRIGAYHLTFEADERGRILRSSRTKHGVLFRAAGVLGRGAPLTLTALRHYRATEPLGRLIAGSVETGETLGRSAFVGLASAGAAILRTAAGRSVGSSALPEVLGRASRDLEDAAVISAAVASYRSAERATAEARRALSAALSCADPRAVSRAKRALEAAEEAKRLSLQEGASGLLHGPAGVGSLAARSGRTGAPRPSALARTEQPAPTQRPATTGASLQGLAQQLRKTRSLVERIRQAASDLEDLSSRPGVPEEIRRRAHAYSAEVDAAIHDFRRAIGASDDEAATHAARLAFEERVLSIAATHQGVHLALADLPKG